MVVVVTCRSREQAEAALQRLRDLLADLVTIWSLRAVSSIKLGVWGAPVGLVDREAV